MNEETRKKLAQDLPANAVKTRDQAGQKLSYIDGHFAVTRANEVFGHDGWSCAVRSIAEVYRGTRPGRDGENVVMVYEAHVAVTALGITREDVGIGQCDASIKALAQGIEKGRKEAVTDGLKRALRTFGASFGLALYDKTQADVGASFRAQEIIAGYDAATDDARLESLRGDVRDAWDELSADDRAALGEARDRATKRIAKSAKPKPADPRDLGPLGVEAPRTERGRDHVREATASVGGDNPTIGEHNVAVVEAVADEKPAPKEEHPVLTAFCARVTEIELPGECVTVWMKHRAALADLPAPDREDAWKTLCQCCETVGHMKAGTAKTWLKGAIGAEDEKRAAQPAPEVQS